MERETIKSTLKKEKQHCSKAKQFQTILHYVKARVNSGRLIFIGDETRSENMLSPSHFLWVIFTQINLTRQFQRGIRTANVENYGK
ncbi:hypothetical protein T08_4460 [Trichinella sp. T8]|nr:hypothetical protein T08_4460 [Trichinella sp. T8]